MQLFQQMKNLLFLLLVTSLTLNSSLAQSVGVGTSNPDASAKLDVVSNNSGIMIPRIALTSTTDILTVPSPTTSVLVYNTATINDVIPGFYYWDGSKWTRIINDGTEDQDWLETDNTTAEDIADNIYTNGTVGIGTVSYTHLTLPTTPYV